MHKKFAISSCLLGVKCRYCGDSSPDKDLIKIFNSGYAIPICPETLGGLETPREPAEIVIDTNGNRDVVDINGTNLTREFNSGAKAALILTTVFGAKTAILKSNSPSCGSCQIYDGTFTGNKVNGIGITAELFINRGVEVFNEKNWNRDKNRHY